MSGEEGLPLTRLCLAEPGEVVVVVCSQDAIYRQFTPEGARIQRGEKEALQTEGDAQCLFERWGLDDLALRDPLDPLRIGIGLPALNILAARGGEGVVGGVMRCRQGDQVPDRVHDLAFGDGSVGGLVHADVAVLPWSCRTGSPVSALHEPQPRLFFGDIPVGVSSQRKIMPSAVAMIRMEGTMKDTLHATWWVSPCFSTRESKMAGITK